MMRDWEPVAGDVERIDVPGGWLYRVFDPSTDAVTWTGFVADPPAGDAIARALRDLGTGNAATPMGAVELLAMEVKGVASALSSIADGLDR